MAIYGSDGSFYEKESHLEADASDQERLQHSFEAFTMPSPQEVFTELRDVSIYGPSENPVSTYARENPEFRKAIDKYLQEEEDYDYLENNTNLRRRYRKPEMRPEDVERIENISGRRIADSSGRVMPFLTEFSSQSKRKRISPDEELMSKEDMEFWKDDPETKEKVLDITDYWKHLPAEELRNKARDDVLMNQWAPPAPRIKEYDQMWKEEREKFRQDPTDLYKLSPKELERRGIGKKSSLSDESPDPILPGQQYAMEYKKSPIEGRLPRGESSGGGGRPTPYETVNFARGRPNEAEILRARLGQIERDLRQSFPDKSTRPPSGERNTIKERLKELKNTDTDFSSSMKRPQLGDALTAEIDKQAAGMAPIGRGGKLTVSRRPDLDLENYGFKAHLISDPKDKIVGRIDLSFENKGKDVYIDNIFSWTGPNTLGKKEMRHAIDQIRKMYPETELIYGYRVSGAREKAGERFLGGVGFTPEARKRLREKIAAGPKEPVGTSDLIERGVPVDQAIETSQGRYSRRTRRIEQQTLDQRVRSQDDPLEQRPWLGGDVEEVLRQRPDRFTTEDLQRLIRELDEELARRGR